MVKAGRNYIIDTQSSLRLDYFCREKFYLLLSLIAELTDFLYDESLKRPYLERLNTFKPESVMRVLLRISKKDFWADRLVQEKELREFLNSKGIDFSELVEEVTYSEGTIEKAKETDNCTPIFEKTYFKPIGNLRVSRSRFLFNDGNSKDKKPEIERIEEPTYSITLSSLGLEDYITKEPQFSKILDALRRGGLVYVIKTKNEVRYGSIRDDLKSVIFALDDLDKFKWSSIQMPEVQYFRLRTPEEIETTRRILGDKADDYFRKEKEEKYRLWKAYREWKMKPEHFFPNFLDVVDKNGNVTARITHKEYVQERKAGFKNWKGNKRLYHVEREGKKQTISEPFFLDREMTTEQLDKLLKTCRKIWKGKPKHFLEREKERLRKNKKKYKASVEKFKEQSKPIVERYEYLMPIFELLNKDVFN